MHCHAVVLFLTFFFHFTQVLSSPSTHASLLALSPTNKNTVAANFTGSYGGHAYSLTGTVQEVMAQLKQMHPDVELEKSELVPRAALNKIMPPLCIPIAGWDWTSAYLTPIDAGIYNLQHLNTRLGMPPHSCSRISCSYNGAIWLCNDNDGHIEPASPYIASYAQDLVSLCGSGSWDKYPVYRQVGGQEFDSDWYNVIAREDRC